MSGYAVGSMKNCYLVKNILLKQIVGSDNTRIDSPYVRPTGLIVGQKKAGLMQ